MKVQRGTYLGVLLFYLLSGLTIAQPVSILDTYVQEALENNLNIKSIDLSRQRQNSKVDQARKQWQPNLNLDASYLFAQGGRTIVFPIGDLFNPAYGALNRLSGNEEFPTNLENVRTQLTPNNFIDASISVSKPLINSALKHNVLIQKALVDLSDADQQMQRNEIAFQVKQAYFNHLKTIKGRDIIEENIDLLKEIESFNKKLIKYDKATPDVVTDITYQIARLRGEIQSLNEQREISQILLNTILNRDISDQIMIDSSYFDYQPSKRYDLKRLVSTGLTQRSEFKKLEIADKVNELNRLRIEGNSQPTLGVRGAVGVQAEEFSFDDGGPLYTIGFNMGWNIWDGGLRKQQLAEVKIAKEQNQLETEIASSQITLQIAQSYHHLQTLYAQLATQNAAIVAAEESYTAIDRRYRNDRALLIELLSSQSNLTNSKLNKVLLIIDILIAEADINRLTTNI